MIEGSREEEKRFSPMHLHAQIRPLLVSHNIDIRFLSNTDLVSDRVDGVPLGHGFHSEVIVSSVGQSIAVVCFVTSSTPSPRLALSKGVRSRETGRGQGKYRKKGGSETRTNT